MYRMQNAVVQVFSNARLEKGLAHDNEAASSLDFITE